MLSSDVAGSLISVPNEVRRVVLSQPLPFLRWLSQLPGNEALLSDFEVLEPWALVALASVGRAKSGEHASVIADGKSDAARFAHALGFEEVTHDQPTNVPLEAEKTVRLQRVREFPYGHSEYERISRQIAHLLLAQAGTEAEEAAKTVRYVLNELQRNVVQHSQDSEGGVVVAQRMYQSTLQVAVADNGIGIYRHLQRSHPQLRDSKEALVKAIEPHISGTFAEGLTGSQNNAGLGLFFVSEMTKLTAGRMLVASRGAALLLSGDQDNPEKHHIDLLDCDFPGTLVVFEAPIASVHDYQGMIDAINAKQKERTPRRVTTRWLRFEEPAPNVTRLLASVAAEDTASAEKYARETLLPRITNRQSFALDMRHFDILTQSFVHALLYEPIRVAWALRVPIYVVKASTAVQSSLEFLESYALGG